MPPEKQPALTISASDICMWDHRWADLDDCINNLAGNLKTQLSAIRQGSRNKARSTPLKTARKLASDFREFADTQFHFFLDGLGSKNEYAMDYESKYPATYILGAILYQVSSDYNIHEQIFAERAFGSLEMVNALDLADGMVFHVLKSNARALGLPVNPPILTYLLKDVSINSIPYNDAAVIGIPHTCITNKRDFLPIPHEVGHYIYGRARKKYKPAKASNSIRYAWFEEIFADTFAALAAGPVMALSSQDLQLLSSQDSFSQDNTQFNSNEEFPNMDYRHPIPAIRPFIYTHVLRKKGMTAWANALDARWIQLVGDRNINLQTFKKQKQQMLTVVSEILKIQELQPAAFTPWASPELESKPPKSIDDLSKMLYERYETYLADEVKPLSKAGLRISSAISRWKPSTPCAANVKLSTVWKDWVTNSNFFPDPANPNAATGILPPVKLGGHTIPANTAVNAQDGWVQVFVAGGWATRAPNSMW